MSLSKVWAVAGPPLGAAAGAALAVWATKCAAATPAAPEAAVKMVPPIPTGSGPAMSLEGKVALVTGGGTGIGREIARVLHAAGAKVVITGRRSNVLEKTVEELGEGVGFVCGDVGSEADAEAMVESCVSQFGSCDILINNAGIVSAWGKFSDVSADAFDEVIKTNLRGTFLVSKAAIRQMIKQGNGGSIVNNSSCCGLAAWKHGGAYGASKGGINTMTQCMAVDHGADGIRCNGQSVGGSHRASHPGAMLRNAVMPAMQFAHEKTGHAAKQLPCGYLTRDVVRVLWLFMWRAMQRSPPARSTRMTMRPPSRWPATLSLASTRPAGSATWRTLGMRCCCSVRTKALGLTE
jgi:NAD(P)-dependent dehydrogenase (short-subunit alcohol dehydrogenase family)